MRHQFSLIVKKAGLEPIPRPFDSMREIRSTEIYNAFGAIMLLPLVKRSSNRWTRPNVGIRKRLCQNEWRHFYCQFLLPDERDKTGFTAIFTAASGRNEQK